jgi:hypothetical protein
MKKSLYTATKMTVGLTLIGFMALANTQHAHAQTALNSVVVTTTALNNNWSLGWEFTVNSTINVTELGVFDKDGDGLTSSHPVGIFRVSDGALLTSTTITTTDTLDGGFRYKPVSSTSLTTGESYRIAAVYTLPGLDEYPNLSNTFTADGAINFVTDRFTQTSVLTNPTTSAGHSNAYLSSNFKFESASTAAPEPGTMALLAVGGAGFASRLRRRKTAL